MSDISPELIERMEALVRKIADKGTPHYGFHVTLEEAVAIVADLPVPIDPDLLEARKIADQKRRIGPDGGFQACPADNHPIVAAALAGIKRGRELAGAAS